MKVGIITFHYPHNFGAMLQAYALKKKLSNMGYNTELVDYRCRKVDEEYKKVTLPNLKSIKQPINYLKRIYSFLRMKPHENEYKLRWKKFDEFWKDVLQPALPTCEYEWQLANTDYDAFVCGSDQIWNPVATKGLRRAYFGDIKKDALRIAYAASVGSIKDVEKNKDILIEEVKKMDAVSVRESELADYLMDMAGIATTHVLDPSLLFIKEDYSDIIKKPNYAGDYVLVYNKIGEENSVSKYAKKIARAMELPIVEVSGRKLASSYKGYTRIADAGPGEFLGWIQKAAMVITDSFHGVAFSLVFQKSFYFIPTIRATRVKGLLDILELKDRAVNGSSIEIKPIDYSRVIPILNQEREKSLQFLGMALSSDRKVLEPKRRACYLNTHNKRDCYGCYACQEVCASSAIEMIEDEQGFVYPVIDNIKCTGCNRCRKVCQKTHFKYAYYPISTDIPEIYAAKVNSDEILDKSSSGGIFTLLSDYILGQNGVIFGAAYNDKLEVQHGMASDCYQRDAHRESKYVQSNMKDTYINVKDTLDRYPVVLFTGTPCQIAGLYAFLSKKYDNLITCDMACSGVGSPKIFREFLNEIEVKYNSKIERINFRYKKSLNNKKWNRSGVYVKLQNKKELLKTPLVAAYMQLFGQMLITRPSCLSCEYAGVFHPADLTIGDYWGVEKTFQDFDDGKGVSLVLLNSVKGKAVWNQIIKNESVECRQGKLEKAIQRGIDGTHFMREGRDKFWKDYEAHGVGYVLSRYGHNTKTEEFKYEIKKHVLKKI